MSDSTLRDLERSWKESSDPEQGEEFLRALARTGADKETRSRVQEHYSYCPDIVDQLTGSSQALAASLLTDRVCYFWWD